MAQMSRRAVVKGTAWATPVLIVGRPAAAQASSLQDVAVTGAGYTSSNNSATVNFSVCAVGSALASGSTFTLTVTGTTSVALSGTLVTNSTVVQAGTTYTFTTTGTLAAGACWTLGVALSSIGGNNTATATLKVGTTNGNANSDTTNDSAAYTCVRTNGSAAACS
ncbi:hypothetical protein G9U51_12620 [Calidifontibacter sp. DB0510]|uniref:Uncharacterized protein n=1 Tax=Metallococcus carri TaxID=1656884 RepID=A0A967B0N9_9MICO|nr:hypothetical protein [Metallococcus carri]NHN56624.1 hypothetical protein [Metallococcus carri]NOP38923.1 hypothetical protein [Calidifontibacter sp. DB2511S]